jgi:tetratricopeptide (TPR) repeat protein
LGRNLSFGEWRDHFGEVPYSKTVPNLPIHHSFIEAGRDSARAGDRKEAVAIFHRASELEHGLDLDPVAEAQKIADAFALLNEGEKLVKQGKVKEAISAYEQAQVLDPTIVVSAAAWDILCRFGSLWGSPSNVMYACENAVTLEPVNVRFRDSRGLARVLTENYPGAIEDFQEYVTWGSWGRYEQPEEDLRKREKWIQELKAGQSPFDAATLQALRNGYETGHP